MNREEIELSLEDVSPSVIIIDRADDRFEVIEESIASADFGYNEISLNMIAIIKRKLDGKLFSLKYVEEANSCTWPETMIEVFPYDEVVTKYL